MRRQHFVKARGNAEIAKYAEHRRVLTFKSRYHRSSNAPMLSGNKEINGNMENNDPIDNSKATIEDADA